MTRFRPCADSQVTQITPPVLGSNLNRTTLYRVVSAAKVCKYPRGWKLAFDMRPTKPHGLKRDLVFAGTNLPQLNRFARARAPGAFLQFKFYDQRFNQLCFDHCSICARR